jgi:hypothetical protein
MERTFKIIRNKRAAENDFTMDQECDFCDRFASQLIVLPESKYAMKSEYQKEDPFHICATCLQEMQEALAKNIRDNFESDFKEARQSINQGYDPSLLKR